MKFLSSSSSAASTITTTSSSSSSSAGCLISMLRQLLCFNSLPKDTEDKFKFLETEEKTGAATNPGLVARLMGLDSMPETNLANTQMNSNSIARSRSENYDCRREIEEIQEQQHRRVRTSLSFRNLPTFLEIENDEFFVLSFENGGESKEFRSKARRSEVGSGKLRRRKADRCSRRSKFDKENKEPDEVESNKKVNRKTNQKLVTQSNGIDKEAKQSKTMNYRENCNVEAEKEERISTANTVETECNTENSSPVSVLDFVESIIDLEVPTSEEDERLKGLNSRRKLSTELENYEQLSPSPCKQYSSSTSDGQKRKLIDGIGRGSRKKDYQRQSYAEMWDEICKMAEGDEEESNWVYKQLWKLEDIKGIGAEFGLQILETLLNELVDQLVETSHEQF